MEFVEGSRGVYRPIRVLFDTPIYERALQICWHIQSYKTSIAVVTELLRLQHKQLISSEVTVEDMINLLFEDSRKSLRVQLWEFELEDFDEDEAKPLLKLVWDVNNNMKGRDIEFEARKLLTSPQDIPPCFQHPNIISTAQKYGRRLTEQLYTARRSKLLSPQEVVMEVVPKVVQHFWVPPRKNFLNMPSQRLSEVAIGVTKAVLDRIKASLPSGHQVTVSRFIRDSVVQSIVEKVKQMYPQDIQRRKLLNTFAAQVLSDMTETAASEICTLFQPPTRTTEPAELPAPTPSSPAARLRPSSDCFTPKPPPTPPAKSAVTPAVLDGEGISKETAGEPDSAPAPASLAETPEPLATTSVRSGSTIGQTEPEPPAPTQDPDSPSSLPFAPLNSTVEFACMTISESDSNMVPPLPSSGTATHEPPAVSAVLDDLALIQTEPIESAETASVLDGEDICKETARDTDSALAPATPPVAPADKLPATTSFQSGSTINQTESAEPEPPVPAQELNSPVWSPTPAPLGTLSAVNISLNDGDDIIMETTRDPISVVAPALAPPVTPADELPVIAPEPDPAAGTPPAELFVIVSDLNGEDMSKEPSTGPDSVVTQAPQALPAPHHEPLVIIVAEDEPTVGQAEVKETSGVQNIFSWFRKTLCCL